MRRKSSKKSRLGITLALAALLAAASAFAAPPPTGPKVGLNNGDLSPAFTLQTLDGKTLSRDGLKGKVVLLDFWATWCAPCRKALPELKELKGKFSGKPLVIVSVSIDDSSKVVEDFVRSNGMTWPQAWDGGLRVTGGIFRVSSFPSYVVLGADSRIAYRQHGWSPGRSAVLLDQAVSNALSAMDKGAAAKGARGSVNTRR